LMASIRTLLNVEATDLYLSFLAQVISGKSFMALALEQMLSTTTTTKTGVKQKKVKQKDLIKNFLFVINFGNLF